MIIINILSWILIVTISCCFFIILPYLTVVTLIDIAKDINKTVKKRLSKHNEQKELIIPKPIQFNIKREPIRLTFDNIEYFEIRDGEVVRDKFEDEIVEYETELVMTILNGYQYKKVLKQ